MSALSGLRKLKYVLEVKGVSPPNVTWLTCEAVEATKLSQQEVIRQRASRGDRTASNGGTEWLGQGCEGPTKKQKKDLEIQQAIGGL